MKTLVTLPEPQLRFTWYRLVFRKRWLWLRPIQIISRMSLSQSAVRDEFILGTTHSNLSVPLFSTYLKEVVGAISFSKGPANKLNISDYDRIKTSPQVPAEVDRDTCPAGLGPRGCFFFLLFWQQLTWKYTAGSLSVFWLLESSHIHRAPCSLPPNQMVLSPLSCSHTDTQWSLLWNCLAGWNHYREDDSYFWQITAPTISGKLGGR